MTPTSSFQALTILCHPDTFTNRHISPIALQAIACAVDFDDQHCGIYAGDADSYEDFKDVFEPIILEYHGLKPDFSHASDMDADKIVGNIDSRY